MQVCTDRSTSNFTWQFFGRIASTASSEMRPIAIDVVVHIGATWPIRLNDLLTATMRLNYVGHLYSLAMLKLKKP